MLSQNRVWSKHIIYKLYSTPYFSLFLSFGYTQSLKIQGVYSLATSSGYSRQLLQYVLWFLFLLPSLSLSAVRLVCNNLLTWDIAAPSGLRTLDVPVMPASFPHGQRLLPWLFILFISPQVRHVWHCVCHLCQIEVWVMSHCQHVTKTSVRIRFSSLWSLISHDSTLKSRL